METILYKPLFINPQAYYVFPNINGRLEPKTGSGKEPAIFVGNIEVKTIAHGDIGKKQYFYNTNEIDLSAFSNSLVRISLYTSRGNVVLGEWNLDVVEGESEDYIDPEVLASLVAVCICDGKSNNDPDRAVIKNLVDPDNPFVISNAAYKLNSGYGKYEEDFTTWRISKSDIISTITHNSVHITHVGQQGIKEEGLFENNTKVNRKFNIKLKITGLTSNTRCSLNNEYKLLKQLANGVNEISADLVTGWYGFMITSLDGSVIGDCDITITQIPSFEGAFVTDGKDDLITSTKTVKEMLGGSSEITVVSMMLNLENEKFTYTNQIRPFQNGYIRNNVISNTEGKCGIYGYKITDISDIFKNRISINDILGDRKDYSMDTGGTARIDGKFSVEGYCFNDGTIGEVSQVAWYWTIISKIALTTDQINQVISYFNLDKHVKPDVYYDVKKQGLSNDTPEADWYLKDFSGNGHDMTLYNFAKKLGSGIGKYEVDFNTWTPQSYVADFAYTSNKLHITNIKGGNAILYTRKGANAMKVKITGIQSFNLVYRYIAENDVWEALEVDRDGIYELPASTTTTKTYYTGFTVPYYTGDCDITIEQIPDYEGALVSDGIDDYGKVENLPIYKDYTVVADREIIDGLAENADGGVAVRGTSISNGAFGFDYKNEVYSFATPNSKVIDVERFISYQSKYVNNGTNINAGNIVDANPLTIGKLGSSTDRYSKLALWSFLLFPYSLSEFLLERQLKRYKLGTLYPDMVEFRPVISGNIPYNAIEISQGSTTLYNKSINKTGIYLQEGSTVRVYIQPSGIDEVSKITVNGVEYTDLPINPNGFYYADFPIAKSPQKISYAIDEYIRYEDIVQPYPAIINLKQDGKTITWGDKLKVGSDIVFVGSANLLPELYTVSETRYNGVTLYPNTIIKVEKSMVFDNARTYLKANEPNCILSPNRLRIPNSSYKILGYIPDLTGKGNHGVINNSAYAGMSGANGYKYDWNTYTSHIAGVKPTDNAFKVNLTAETSTTALFGIPVFTVGSKSHYFRFKISGLINNQKIQIDYPKGSDDTVITSDRFGNGEYSTKDYTVREVKRLNFYVINAVKGEPISVSIEQLPEYESSFCLDGVDDFVTIPTLSHGGKQVLMKVNYKLSNSTCTIYDQREPARWLPTFCIYSNNEVIAYSDGNSGKTYIDGVLNTSVKGRQLANITHNITIANEDVTDVNSVSPKIGTLFVNGSAYAQMALFDFMLFPEISSENEIKELNDIIGIEGNTDDLLTKINI